ncbi:putative ribonuclease H-like domain-containing protein [Tanacetum coccineum]
MKLDFGDHYNNAEGIWRHDMKGASSSNSQNSNSKALVAKYSQGEIDWTKEFDDDPVTFAMVALNGIEEDDWSIEIDADHVDLGQDGLGVFDWSEEVDNAPVNPEKKEALKEIMLIIDGVALGKREPSRSTCNRFEKPAISTSGGCQYLGRRLVSWQCKKQTIVAISSTEAEYVAAASCCGQVHTDDNVADLLTKGFDLASMDFERRFDAILKGRVGFEEMLSEIGRFCFDQ